MEIGLQFQRLGHIQIHRWLLIMSVIVAVVVLIQNFALPYKNYISILSHNSNGTRVITVSRNIFLNSSVNIKTYIVVNSTNAFKFDEEAGLLSEEGDDENIDFASDDDVGMENFSELNNITIQRDIKLDNSSPKENIITNNSLEKGKKLENNSDGEKDLEQTVSAIPNNKSMVTSDSIMKRRGMKLTSISQMNLLLLQPPVSTKRMRPRQSSARDRELQNARLQVENAPIIRHNTGLDSSLFRNVSIFIRSYEVMERVLKVYIYREGEKPIFHQPYMRGIYASEGWFMKLMEGNKKFVVRDPKKAHLFYLPFSSVKLRSILHEEKFANQRDLETKLKDYVDMIAKKYHLWNRVNGSDHFLVACHDWAPRFTRNSMGTCIRALCNTNVASGFKIGKDVSLPVTYIRSSQNPQKDLGGNPPSERPILAFFAGGMHGNLRPTLLHYWNNKVPDMKIFGPMPRDIEGKARYRELMKTSKYCICAKGYEVHTPRVVESIYYECVPVIISDNYVPPFFEVLDWESFCVFVLEEDVPNLRNILLSIPEEKYIAMQRRVKMVQQHFLWHKNSVKYDLFHMTLHSIWYNRLFQV